MKASIDLIQQHYHMLCKTIGTRHLGSEGEIKAAKYLEEQFKKLGYDSTLEYYESPGWTCSSYELSIKETGEKLEVCPCFFSKSCDIEGPLTMLQSCDIVKLNSLDLTGKICLVDLPTDVGGNIKGRNELAEELDRKGVAAAIFISNNQDTYNTKIVRTPNIDQLATLSVSGNTAIEIARNNDKTFIVKVDAETVTYQSPNVVARKGNGKRKLVVGAHYDTAPYIEGACDNGSGTVAIVEIARLLAEVDFDHQLEFVAFGGEEYGGIPGGFPIGSFMYVQQHEAEWNTIDCVINLDDVGFVLGSNNVFAQGDDEMAEIVNNELGKMDRTLATNYPGSSDERSFLAKGIPAVLMMGSNNQYVQIHTPADNLSIISMEKTAEAVEMGAGIVKALDNFTRNP